MAATSSTEYPLFPFILSSSTASSSSRSFVGLDVHNDQVPFPILGEENRLPGLSALLGDLVVVLADGRGWTDDHRRTSPFR